MNLPALTAAPIQSDALIAAVAGPDHGAIATFLGTTRADTGTREVVALDYAAYPAVAESEIAAIVDEAAERFGATVCIQHRTGRVAVGEVSVAVAASAPHRPAAFAACRYAIDELKVRVPIWKHAHFADGTTTWFDGSDSAVFPNDAAGA
jgi:molybdopterin synthase catalytic subunit